MNPQTLTLFHAPRTRSLRPLWLMEEMGLKYDLVTMNYDADYFASEKFRAINPMGKIPALYDGKQLIIESTVIMEYLLNLYGPSNLQRDKEHPEYAKYLQWFHMAESGVSGYLATLVGFRLGWKKYVISKEYEAYCVFQVEKAFEMLEHDLNGQKYLISDGFSAADISIGYTLYLANILVKLPLSEALTTYFSGLQERDAWQRVVAITP